MEPQWASATHPGRRQYNQDKILTALLPTREGVVRLIAVLDGMGGMRAGDRASQLAAEVFLQSLTTRIADARPSEDVLRRVLFEAVGQAHRAVYDEGQGDPEKRGMGTTLVAALEKDGRFLVINVGDSRAYLWSPDDNRLLRLTRDHSIREEAVRLGKLTESQAKNSPFAHALTRAVGAGTLPEPDVYPEPEGWFALPRGGVLLLCSDGASGALDDAAVAAILAGSPTPAFMTDCLLRTAYEQGSSDNISVVVLVDPAFRPIGDKPRLPPPIGEDAAPPPVEEPVDDAPEPVTLARRGTWIWVMLAVLAIVLLALLTLANQEEPAPPKPLELSPAPMAAPAPPVDPAVAPATVPTETMVPAPGENLEVDLVESDEPPPPP
jgi:protein phosphatase